MRLELGDVSVQPILDHVPAFRPGDTIPVRAHLDTDPGSSRLEGLIYRTYRNGRLSSSWVDTAPDVGNSSGDLVGTYRPKHLVAGTYILTVVPLGDSTMGQGLGKPLAGWKFRIVRPPSSIRRISRIGTYTAPQTGVRVSCGTTRLDLMGGRIDAESRAGTTFVLIRLIVHNGGTSPYTGDPSLDMDILGQNNTTFSWASDLSPTFSPRLGSTTLPPGATETGWIGAQIPLTVKRLTLIWHDPHFQHPVKVAAYTLH